MSIFKGFGLSSRIAAKHFGKIGDELAGVIAAADPETAMEVDRDALVADLRAKSVLLAKARAAYDEEHAILTQLAELVQRGEQIVPTLAGKLERGEITEETVNTFLDELEANKNRLAVEQEKEDQAISYRDQVQELVATLSKQLTEFDEHAQKSVREIQSAKADLELQQLKQQQDAELQRMASGIRSSSNALSALSKKAQTIRAEAEAARIVTEASHPSANQSAEVQSLYDEAAGKTKLSAADRLKAMMPAA